MFIPFCKEPFEEVIRNGIIKKDAKGFRVEVPVIGFYVDAPL
jgi:hypothetical protein